MKKVLILASVASMIDQFNMMNIDILIKMGYEVHVAANFKQGSTSSKKRVEEFEKELKIMKIPFFHVDFSRKLIDFKANTKAFIQVKNLMVKNKYEFVHCHSPIGGVCGRLAGYKTKTRVIYTAHGFHFFKGAPMKNWSLYYPIEKWLARFTDILITINKEDYSIAKKSFKAKKIEYVPGIGVDTSKVIPYLEKDKKKSELKITKDTIIILSVGELSKRKNHEVIIKALAKIKHLNISYLICGYGDLDVYLKKLSNDLGVYDKVEFLGFRKDIAEICLAADLFVFPSKQEGLPVAMMEAMLAGLPVVCSKIRGNTDLIEDGRNGYLVEVDDIDGYKDCMNKLIGNDELRREMGLHNSIDIAKYDKEVVNKKMKKIYSEMI
ncbi:hypothetical protein BK125_22950 [Paenibacillus odorifer]|uniref:glycosyltransferase family 4 protein n=1 Tax=Paenibacillus odorifer TaxID=189426 RepID=UPI00096DD5E5|nr:glycosyltransferase family 4 protein [Paenibacillus odorifer]OMC73880.1 hypothetical protein BK125_22950 [Paenibacillus odorifer]